MRSHPYIELRVPERLEPKSAKLWRETVTGLLPNGLLGQAEILKDGESKQSSFYGDKQQDQMCYVIPLTRDLTVAEAQKIAMAWDKAYAEGDFEVDYSATGESKAVHHELQENSLREIAMEAAKSTHTDWINEMQERGWRYGAKFDQRNKQNPLLMPWEQLSKKYQLQELRRFEKLVEVLDRMELQLVRKRK